MLVPLRRARIELRATGRELKLSSDWIEAEIEHPAPPPNPFSGVALPSGPVRRSAPAATVAFGTGNEGRRFAMGPLALRWGTQYAVTECGGAGASGPSHSVLRSLSAT